MYTIMWYDSKNTRHTVRRKDLFKAQGIADVHNGHVYDENEDRVYPEPEKYLSYDDISALNDILIRNARNALERLAKS
jgi:hypothetical protein